MLSRTLALPICAADGLKGGDRGLKVQRPMIVGEKGGPKGGTDELKNFVKGQVLACQMNALTEPEFVEALAAAGVTGFARELMPRISRAQSMEIGRAHV